MPGSSAVLHIIGGNDRGKQHELSGAEVRIGRGTDQDLVLADIAVSRRHVTIVAEGQRWRLKDLGSGNGSLVNGQRNDSVILNDGDQIEIGNTLMRFDHPPSRPMNAGAPPANAAPPPYAAPPNYPPPGYGQPPPPQNYPPSQPSFQPGYAPPPAYPQNYPPPGYNQPPGYPPNYPPQPSGYPPPGYGNDAPPTYSPAPPAPSYVLPAGVRAKEPGGAGSFLATPTGKITAFGGMGFLSLIGLIVILSKTLFAASSPVSNEAEDFYRQGLRLFAAGDYELAKSKFTDVTQLAPDAPEARRYARLCDSELAAKAALQNAERALVNRRYTEAVRAFDSVEPTSVHYDQASKQRHDAAPKAAAELVEEAKRLQHENADEARSRLRTALELDPDNTEARDLFNNFNGKSEPAPTPVAATPTPATPTPVAQHTEPPPSAATMAAVSKHDKHPVATEKPAAGKKGAAGSDDDLVAVKGMKADKGGPVPESKAGMTAYKARDFAGAAKAYRAESTRMPEKQATKMLDVAGSIQQMQQLVERAQADEAKAPAQAVKEYDQAIALDSKISKGALQSFFKGRISALGTQAAKQAFADGKYEQAYNAAVASQKSGSDASAILKQLDQKANELIQQGINVQKSNLGQAKTLWRTAVKIVPTSSATYTKAYTLLNNTTTQKRDEDED